MPQTNEETPKSKGYNPQKHSTLPYVDKEYKVLLDKIAEKTGRTRKKAIELLIAEAGEK